MIKILDLFCGLGGVARGFQEYLIEKNIKFEYYAVDIDFKILLTHKILNPKSITIKKDAYSLRDEELKEYDFIWASPPCETHSHLNFYNWNNPKKFKPPDMRLYKLIKRLHILNIPFIVENVKPYYKPPIKPCTKIGRHILWSNISLKPFKVNLPNNFTNVKDDVKRLADYHELDITIAHKIKKILGISKTKAVLRDMVHWRIAYKIAEQVIPQILKGKLLKQTILVKFLQ